MYEKNLSALKKNRPKLHKKIEKIDSNIRYEVFVSDENINILDKLENIIFYDKPEESIKKRTQELEKYREYPFLYLFGIASGKVVELLLKTDKLTQLVVIEPNLELIYIALNLTDLSKDIKSNRLLILDSEEVDYSLMISLMHNSNAKFYIRVFEFIINTEYYEKIYLDEYRTLFDLWIKTIDYVANGHGNDINDTFRGLKQHTENMNLMLETPSYKELLRKKTIKTAVIVSTGPSLDKQIPLLKKYQDRVSILSVDASFPILIKHGIKPDFVFSMERDEPTSIFFKELDVQKQKDIIFVCASLQHKSVYDAIKLGTKVIVSRPFAYASYYELDEYGYLCKGMSSANMAHEFSSAMGYKQITFIGQDLSFGKDMQTHSNDHVIQESNLLLEEQIKQNKLIEVEAYGGEEKVLSNIYWNMFRNFIEHHIEESKHVTKAYNSTQGGSKIKGAIEIPFEEYLKKYANTRKTQIYIELPKKEEIYKTKEIVKQKNLLIIKELSSLKKEIDKSFLIIAEKSKKLENLSEDEAIKVLGMNETIFLLENISKIRKDIENSQIYTKFLISIIQPLMYSMEVEIAEIKVRFVDNPKDNQLKAIQWILAHRFWLFSFSGVIENVLNTIQKDYKLES